MAGGHESIPSCCTAGLEVEAEQHLFEGGSRIAVGSGRQEDHEHVGLGTIATRNPVDLVYEERNEFATTLAAVVRCEGISSHLVNARTLAITRA